eukprot:TRINITY_DN612_c0_g1_i1.p1 TRINITY_DN612_c0_g1~~TRINITY_DN612_c0_g1_i1.p1  ORF type:complete len:169 (-),score=22.07 TRINITY_DN612_c0_g1_i1:37-543(-)
MLSDQVVLNAGSESMARAMSLTTGTVPNSSVAPGTEWTRDAVLPLPNTTGPTVDGSICNLIERSYTLKIEAWAGSFSTLTLLMDVVLWGGSNSSGKVKNARVVGVGGGGVGGGEKKKEEKEEEKDVINDNDDNDDDDDDDDNGDDGKEKDAEKKEEEADDEHEEIDLN